MKIPKTLRANPSGFTLMELLVVIAIILVLAAIALPTIQTFQSRQYKIEATGKLRDLCAAAQTYANDNNDELPREDSKGEDSWKNAADPENKNAWYNALPTAMGRRSVGDYAANVRAFYTKENFLFFRGAGYPEGDKRLTQPYFAVSINTKLQRNDEDGKKNKVKRAMVAHQSRTALFLTQGMPGELDYRSGVQSKRDFDGSPKGSAKSFVGRYGGMGLIAFMDGRVSDFKPEDLLTETGEFYFPQTDVFWTKAEDEDPNKN